MHTSWKVLPLAALLGACGTMQETTQVRDDVYDIPDRTVTASAATSPSSAPDTEPQSTEQDYYDEGESRSQGDYLSRRDFYDMTYNDPYWYNTGRFGWNMGFSSWGPSYGFNYGWPTSWGGVSVGFGSGYYNPYWGNSWMSGYGMWGNPYGWGSPWGGYGYGYPYYGNYGYGPYQGPWGGCVGCYEPVGYGGTIYGHRPSMTGGSGNMNTAGSNSNPRGYRNPVGLIDTRPTTTAPNTNRTFREQVRRPDVGRPARYNTDQRPAARPNDTYARPPRQERPSRQERPARFETGGGRTNDSGSSPSRGGGGSGGGSGGGGGTRTSPRPR